MRRPNVVFSDEYAALRQVLICARLNAGLSQRELARRIGKAFSHIALIERGQRRVDALELCRIADALEVPADQLMARIVEAVGKVDPGPPSTSAQMR